LDFSFDLSLVESQKILLTPRVKQELDILKKSSRELYKYIKEQLERNPVLEIADDLKYTNVDFYISFDDEALLNEVFSNDMESDEQGVYRNDYAYIHKSLMPRMKLSLKDHLLLQLHTYGLDDNQVSIGEYIINNVDENGYLTIKLTEVAKFFNITINNVKKVLKLLQTFDPPGVCARDLKECLLIQLQQKNNKDKNIVYIIENHINDLADGNIDRVVENTGLERRRVEEIFNYIKTLEPKPGREFFGNYNVDYIIPDVIVKKTKNGLDVHINEDSIPVLNTNEYYYKILSADIGNDVKKFIKSRIDSAKWLIKCLDQRKEIIKKVAEAIIKKQSDFFVKGNKSIKPLSISEIADDIEMHESIVASVINGKYIQCMWGVYEMSHFLSAQDKK